MWVLTVVVVFKSVFQVFGEARVEFSGVFF